MKRFLIATAAIAAAVAVLAFLSRPPRRLALAQPWQDGSVRGIMHVHTNRSDGRSSPDEIAAVAARAGLQFVVFTDHGDATRTPDPPSYRSGVLCLDAVEISTRDGHVVAIDMPAAPYPLAGEARDVVEDVHRLGGFAIAAHPDSPKRDLQWRDWTVPVDGIEVINLDTSWRMHLSAPGIAPKLELARALLTYPIVPGETIAALLTNSPTAAWMKLAATRPVVALAGADAHAKLELKDTESGDNRFSAPLPSYAASFDVISTHVYMSAPLGGDAATDARRLLDAIRAGRVYTAVEAWAEPTSFAFTAGPNDSQPGSAAARPLARELHVRSNAPAHFVTSIWNGERKLLEKSEQDFGITVDQPGVFRVEIRDPTRQNGPAWITSNAAYIRADVQPGRGAGANADAVTSAVRRAASVAQPLWDDKTLIHWNTEADRTSQAMLDVAPRADGRSELRLRFALSGGSDIGQFAGATVDTPQGVGEFDRLTFAVRAERPMRLSVQVRVEVSGSEPERYQRSLYVDSDERTQSVLFADMKPVGQTRAGRLPQEAARTILFMVETPNTRPGTTGRIWIRDPRLER